MARECQSGFLIMQAAIDTWSARKALPRLPSDLVPRRALQGQLTAALTSI
jgi:hypothetical protein